jgi:hypothetical protein
LNCAPDQVAVAGSITEALYEAMRTSDLIICDITHLNPNVMYALGFPNLQPTGAPYSRNR